MKSQLQILTLIHYIVEHFGKGKCWFYLCLLTMHTVRNSLYNLPLSVGSIGYMLTNVGNTDS